MNLATLIAVLVLIAIVSLAVRYIYKEKKRGVKCIGCPYADSCHKMDGMQTPGQACGQHPQSR